ncbi:hypothetical protein CK203_043985 [Vitis vinifera]|uniref:Uncharacterized protein n=1 Tax=Vitis vinifera TaxID=29760 RepID=A0A438HTG2_VITVI|nr:hypothetical protein CK203_043985 [Vitis vinifera]
MFQPYEFTCCQSHSSILDFSTRSSHYILFLTLSRILGSPKGSPCPGISLTFGSIGVSTGLQSNIPGRSLRNRALLGKWLWRYPRESTALWHQVILSIYGTHSNGWDANTLVRWSHRCPWKAIAQVFQDFSKYTRLVVGNGERIRFLGRFMMGGPNLQRQYPRLCRVVMDKKCSHIFNSGSDRPFSWNFNFRRSLTDYEIEDLEGLMRSIDCMNLSTSASDARSWSLLSSELFTVKSSLQPCPKCLIHLL